MFVAAFVTSIHRFNALLPIFNACHHKYSHKEAFGSCAVGVILGMFGITHQSSCQKNHFTAHHGVVAWSFTLKSIPSTFASVSKIREINSCFCSGVISLDANDISFCVRTHQFLIMLNTCSFSLRTHAFATSDLFEKSCCDSDIVGLSP